MTHAPQSRRLADSIQAAIAAVSTAERAPLRATSTDDAVVIEVVGDQQVSVDIASSLLRLGPETVGAAVAEAVTQLLEHYAPTGTVSAADRAAGEEALREAEGGLVEATARMEEQLGRLASRLQQGPPPFPGAGGTPRGR